MVEYRKKTGRTTGGDTESIQFDAAGNSEIFHGMSDRIEETEKESGILITNDIHSEESGRSEKSSTSSHIKSNRASSDSKITVLRQVSSYNHATDRNSPDSLRDCLKQLCYVSRYLSLSIIRAYEAIGSSTRASGTKLLNNGACG